MRKMNNISTIYWKLSEYFVVMLQKRLGQVLSSVVLYGSAARGNAGVNSDIDLLIIVDYPQGGKREIEEKVSEIYLDFEDSDYFESADLTGLRAKLEYILLTREEALNTRPFYLDISQDGLVLFDRDDFFNRKLTRLRKRMTELGTRRVFLDDRAWLWELKPGMKPGEVVEL
ncbi:MAG: nucleotidyltransferase domain-containing protein [bacterium]|nr:nucleotidyltransferase domain-containing protein [bacterium]